MTNQIAIPADLYKMTLEELWGEAESYGVIQIYSDADVSVRKESYNARIKFKTMAGISLEASSEFRITLKTALSQAIAKARIIREQFK
jgi:hypothetical protein